MTSATQTPDQAELGVHDTGVGHGHSHAPSPGATAVLIHDLRELFKVKVVGLVLVTGWGGFYLGSMQSGISSVQRGLLDTLLGIGLVSAGAGALLGDPEVAGQVRLVYIDPPFATQSVFHSRNWSNGLKSPTRMPRAASIKTTRAGSYGPSKLPPPALRTPRPTKTPRDTTAFNSV